MSSSSRFVRILCALAAASAPFLVGTAHATALEPLAATMAINRGNNFATPPWKTLYGVPGVRWKSAPEKALTKLLGVMTPVMPVAGVPKQLEVTIYGAPVGFHQVNIAGTVKHGEKNAGSTSGRFAPELFGRASVRRIFTTCDDDGVASTTAHYAVEYEGHKPIYVGFDSGAGNSASTMMWRLHLTEAGMLAASGPTCEREKP